MQSLFADLFGWGVIVSVFAKPLVLGPLGRVSGTVLSLIGGSGLSITVLNQLCHTPVPFVVQPTYLLPSMCNLFWGHT